MTFRVPLSTPSGTVSTQYPRILLAVKDGSDFLCYGEEDRFSPALPAELGTNLLNTPVTLSPRFLGVHCQASAANRLAVGTARNHDMAPRWSQMNPSNGVFQDFGLRAWLARMKAAGAEVVYTVFHTPTWASARPTETGDQYGVLGALAEPASMSTLSSFITWLMTNYGGSIDYLEIWNEPKYINSNSSYFSGTPAKLAEMARTIVTAARAVKPSIQIMGVGCTGMVNFDGSAGEGVGFTNQFLNASDGAAGFGRNWVDIVSIHTYVHNGTNDISLLSNVKTHIDAIKSGGGVSNKRFWSSEWGLITPLFNTYEGTPEGRAKLLFRYALYHVAMGVDRAIWYAYGTNYGWPVSDEEDQEWNLVCQALNGATVSVINRVGSKGELACVINGKNILV